MLLVIVIYTVLGVLTYQGATAPWSPEMTAWSGDPVPEAIVKRATPAAAARGRHVPEQELPELPRPGGDRRPSRPGPDDGRRPADARPAHRPDQQRHAGRRQHAGLRQAGQAGRDDRPGRVPGQPAARRPARRPARPTRRHDGKSRHEPHARRLPPLLAVRSLARPSRCCSARGDLPARLAGPPTAATRGAGTAASSRPSWAAWLRSSWPWPRRSSRSRRCSSRST